MKQFVYEFSDFFFVRRKDHIKRWRVLLFCLLFLIIPNLLSADVQNKILLIHSYHAEYPWVDSITRGVLKVLKDQDVQVEIFYMDTKRKTSLEWKTEAGKLAVQKINSWKPQVVIAVDDNAQIFVTQKFIHAQKPFFVFCGVNGAPEDYGMPAANVTGVLERPHFKDSLEYLKKIYPQVRRIAVMSDDGPTSVGALDYIRNQNVDVKVLNYHLIGDLDVWKTRIKEYNMEADAVCLYMYHTLKSQGAEISEDPKTVMQWTFDHAQIPTIGFFDFAIDDGMLCGIVESGEEHGMIAAKMALDLLHGKDIRSLPIVTAQKGLKMLNLKTAKKLGIDIPKEVIQQADKVFE